MKKIVAIGNSIAAVAALEEIRRGDKESEIALFLEDSHLPSHNYLFGNFLVKAIGEDKIFYKPVEFYKESNINIISGKKIGRIDFKKNRIITLEKEQVSFDMLLITDTSNHHFPDIKGTNKMGVFGLKRFGDIKDILSILHLVDTVVIQADTIEGLRMAQGLKERGKEVFLIIPFSHLFYHFLDKEPADIIEKCLEKNGLRVIKENTISEILGEGEVKAARLKTGKVLASQMAVLGNARADLRVFADSSLEIRQGILVDDYFRTNLENVFAVNSVCELRTKALQEDSCMDFLFLEEQGRIAGLNMTGQMTPYIEPLRFIEFNIFDLSVVFIGETKGREGLHEYVKQDQSANAYKKVFLKDNRLHGAILINSPSEREKMVALVKEKRDVANLEEQVLDKNCDYQQLVKFSEDRKGSLSSAGGLGAAV